MTATLTEDLRHEIDDAVRGASQPDVLVRDVSIDERGETAEPYIVIQVKLAQPQSESWPADVFYNLRRRIRNAVVHSVGGHVDFRLTYVPDDTAADTLEGVTL